MGLAFHARQTNSEVMNVPFSLRIVNAMFPLLPIQVPVEEKKISHRPNIWLNFHYLENIPPSPPIKHSDHPVVKRWDSFSPRTLAP